MSLAQKFCCCWCEFFFVLFSLPWPAPTKCQEHKANCENSTTEATIPFLAEFRQSSSGQNSILLQWPISAAAPEGHRHPAQQLCFPRTKLQEAFQSPARTVPMHRGWTRDVSQGEIGVPVPWPVPPWKILCGRGWAGQQRPLAEAVPNFLKFQKFSASTVFFLHRYWPYLDGKIREALVLRSIKVRLLISFSRDTDPLTFNFVSSLKAICTEVPSCSLKVVSTIHIVLKCKIFPNPHPPKKISNKKT